MCNTSFPSPTVSPTPVLLYYTQRLAFFLANPWRGWPARTLPRLSQAHPEIACRQQARWEGAAKVPEPGRDARGQGRVNRHSEPSPGAHARSPAPLLGSCAPHLPRVTLNRRLGSSLPAELPRPLRGNNFKAKEARPGGLPGSSPTLGPASVAPGRVPTGPRREVGEGRAARRRPGWREGAAREPEGASRPAGRTRTPRPGGCTCVGGAGGRRQGGWLSRVEARRTPIPAACSPRGLQRAHRRHRRRFGFIYPDGRARPGNRNTEAFSCFLTARPSRRTSCGRGIHVPGPAGGSLRARRAAGTAVNPRGGAAAAGAAGAPGPRSPPGPARLPDPWASQARSKRSDFLRTWRRNWRSRKQRPARALGSERLWCKSRVLAGPGVGNFTASG